MHVYRLISFPNYSDVAATYARFSTRLYDIIVKASDVASPSQVTSHFLQVQVKSQVIWSEFKSSHKSFCLNPTQVTSHSEWQVDSSHKSFYL